MVTIIIILQMAELSYIVAANMYGIHTVLAVCGMVDPDNHNLIHTGKVLTSITDFGVFDSNCDVIYMVKRLSSRILKDGQFNIGTVQIKKV